MTNYGALKLSSLLTKMEQHYTWSTFRRHLIVKYYVFKMLNLSLLFISRYIVRQFYAEIRDTFSIFTCASLRPLFLRSQPLSCD